MQVAETLSEDILAKMHAPPKPDVPVLSASELVNADGIIFGMSGRFSGVPAQMKAFWDATGQHWSKGALVNKPVSAFVSTGNLQGGQESIFLTSMPFFVGQVRVKRLGSNARLFPRDRCVALLYIFSY